MADGPAPRTALLDTHLLLWAALEAGRLPRMVAEALDRPGFHPVFSVASLWEVVIKAGLGRADFSIDPAAFRRGLVAGGYEELAVTAPHVLGVAALPALHGDTFDRLLLSQARAEGLALWTVDPAVVAYGAPAVAVG